MSRENEQALPEVKDAIFLAEARDARGLPASGAPEIAIAGRSNVGKSTLLNRLAGRRALARTSKTPGRTRGIVFFDLDLGPLLPAIRLVDLPGYGYAHVAKTDRADFNEAVADYIEGRENLRGVFALIDSRLPPQEIDVDFINWLTGTGVPFVLIFTKTDKLSVSQAQTNIGRFRQMVFAGLDPQPAVFVSSSKTKVGRTQILQYIAGKLAEKPRTTGTADD